MEWNHFQVNTFICRASSSLKYFLTSYIGAIICKIRWIRFAVACFIFGTRRNAGGFVIFRKRIARSIPSPERMNRPFASWNSFTSAGRKMQRLYGTKKELKKEEHKRQPRRIRESVAIPAALQLGEFHVMHRESRLHASNGKRGKITLPFCRLDSRYSWRLYLLLLFIYVY